MNNTITELRESISHYALAHSINEIPVDYYETMLDAWNNINTQGYDWDSDNAAAALLYAAVIDGIIHDSQITTQGYNALNWAEQYLQQLDKLQAAA